MVHFFIVVIGFVFQTIVAIWYFLLPNNPSATQANGAGGLNLVPPAVIVSFIAGCMLLSTLLYAKRIHTRFFGKRSVRSAGPSWMRGLPWVIERSASEKEQDEGVEVEGMMAEGSALTGGARTPGRGAGLNQRRAGKGRGLGSGQRARRLLQQSTNAHNLCRYQHLRPGPPRSRPPPSTRGCRKPSG